MPRAWIAVEYAYRSRDHYQAIFWVNASPRDALSADFVILAALLSLPEQHEQDQDIVVRAVKRWLSTHKHWLLILDNVDDLDMIVDFLPMHGRGDVLLTTRLQALGTVAQSIEVEKMGLDEGVTFLLRRTKLTLPVINGRGFLVQRRSLPHEYCYSCRRGSFSPSVRCSSCEEQPVSECPPVRCRMVDKRRPPIVRWV